MSPPVPRYLCLKPGLEPGAAEPDCEPVVEFTRGGTAKDSQVKSSQVKSSRLSTVRTLHRHRSCQITVLPSALSFFDRSAIRDRGKQNEPEEAD